MRLIHKFSSEGIEAMTDQEIKSLEHEIMFKQPNFMGHLLPALQTELSSRRAEKSNKKAFYISIVALVVSIASFITQFYFVGSP